jgi:hypothetical protein
MADRLHAVRPPTALGQLPAREEVAVCVCTFILKYTQYQCVSVIGTQHQ